MYKKLKKKPISTLSGLPLLNERDQDTLPKEEQAGDLIASSRQKWEKAELPWPVLLLRVRTLGALYCTYLSPLPANINLIFVYTWLVATVHKHSLDASFSAPCGQVDIWCCAPMGETEVRRSENTKAVYWDQSCVTSAKINRWKALMHSGASREGGPYTEVHWQAPMGPGRMSLISNFFESSIAFISAKHCGINESL